MPSVRKSTSKSLNHSRNLRSQRRARLLRLRNRRCVLCQPGGTVRPFTASHEWMSDNSPTSGFGGAPDPIAQFCEELYAPLEVIANLLFYCYSRKRGFSKSWGVAPHRKRRIGERSYRCVSPWSNQSPSGWESSANGFPRHPLNTRWRSCRRNR
jgi:hypothetical protein